MKLHPLPLTAGLFLLAVGCASSPTLSGTASDTRPGVAAPREFTPLFPTNGVPRNWMVRDWSDIAQPAPANARWIARDGVIRGSNPRGTWLLSEAEYGDFVLEVEFRLGERGNGGVGLRLPSKGDPTFEGIEVQWVDPRYFGANYAPDPRELSGALHKAVGVEQRPFRPLEWNQCTIRCEGPRVTVVLNGVKVVDVDLDTLQDPLPRGRPLAERPRRGRIGFQELSRGGGLVEIRNARIQVLD